MPDHNQNPPWSSENAFVCINDAHWKKFCDLINTCIDNGKASRQELYILLNWLAVGIETGTASFANIMMDSVRNDASSE